MSLFLIFQTSELFVNTLAVDEMYPLLMRDNLMIPIQMQFKFRFRKPFSHLFAAFLKFRLNLKYFDTKCYPHRFCLTNSIDLEVIMSYDKGGVMQI